MGLGDYLRGIDTGAPARMVSVPGGAEEDPAAELERRRLQPVLAVSVTLKTDRTIRGAMVRKTETMMILKSAALASFDTQSRKTTWQDLGGEIVLAMDNVDFYQIVDPSILEPQ